MAKRETQSREPGSPASANLFQQMKLDRDQTRVADKLKREELEIESFDYEALSEYEQKIEK